ncbi:MAG: class I SAM-dependent methyltransferase [Chloroflexota bacterium]|nr:MAG: class I SAM-dependent methyltransferase [Chloroflexota bacterium]
MGADQVPVWQFGRGRARQASVRSLLRQTSIALARCPDRRQDGAGRAAPGRTLVLSRVRWVPRERLDSLARRYVQPTDVVLDVGPGIRPQALVRARAHICLDAHRPYLDRVRDRADGGRFVLLHGAWRVAMAMLPDRSVDSVIALDVIEHFTPEDGERFLAEAARVARRQIVLFTPIGFYPQSHTSGEPDRWGLDGGEWQSHRSGWTPDNFGSDWRVLERRPSNHAAVLAG